jgi:1,4-alpha-glucan branching enzyme
MNDFDIHLFREGRHFKLYEKLGSHIVVADGRKGTNFGVWAPNARKVSVIGNFNGWNSRLISFLQSWDGSGIWEGFIPGIGHGEVYKYHIESNYNGYSVEKGDPFAFMWEEPPRTASIVWDQKYSWGDHEWLDHRKKSAGKPKPFQYMKCIWVHGEESPEEGNRHLTYRELAAQLPAYLRNGLYTCRIYAGNGASLLWFMGIPGNRIFCTNQQVWFTPGFYVPDK